MSAEAKQKAREYGQKSGKGSQFLSRLLGRVNGSDSDDSDE